MDSALSGDAEPGAMHNEDYASLNKLIDEDEGFKMETDQSFLDDIARQQAEIIHGFPLASLMGASDGMYPVRHRAAPAR